MPAMSTSPRGELHPLLGHVLDLAQLPAGAVLHPGQQLRHAGQVWTVDELPHCFDNVVVLISGEGEAQKRWCQVCGEVPVGVCEAVGDFDDYED